MPYKFYTMGPAFRWLWKLLEAQYKMSWVDAAIAARQRQLMRRYLGQKYGITI